MNTRRGLPIQLVVADTGPLISLAACDRLDLLKEFRRPVRVPDIVKAECLRDPGKVGAATLAHWFSDPGCPVAVFETPFMHAWMLAVEEEGNNPLVLPTAGMGDAAMAWMLGQAKAGRMLNEPTLILTEDGPFGDGIIRNSFPEVHILSTRAFLQTLENFGRIPSAQSLIEQMASSGRRLARYTADRPGQPSSGTKTTWAEVLIKAGNASQRRDSN